MNIHRFYLPPEDCQGTEWTLPSEESHHAVSVLRLKVGETVVVLNGAGAEWRCEVASVERGTVRIRPKFKNDHAPFPYLITLIQAVTKGKTMDLIVQKAAELKLVPAWCVVANPRGQLARHAPGPDEQQPPFFFVHRIASIRRR